MAIIDEALKVIITLIAVAIIVVSVVENWEPYITSIVSGALIGFLFLEQTLSTINNPSHSPA